MYKRNWSLLTVLVGYSPHNCVPIYKKNNVLCYVTTNYFQSRQNRPSGNIDRVAGQRLYLDMSNPPNLAVTTEWRTRSKHSVVGGGGVDPPATPCPSVRHSARSMRAGQRRNRGPSSRPDTACVTLVLMSSAAPCTAHSDQLISCHPSRWLVTHHRHRLARAAATLNSLVTLPLSGGCYLYTIV